MYNSVQFVAYPSLYFIHIIQCRRFMHKTVWYTSNAWCGSQHLGDDLY